MRTLLPLALLAAAALAAGCARPTQPGAPSADVLTGDARKLQGMWAVVSVEDGRIEHLTGEAKADAERMMRDVRLVFDGLRLTIVERGEDEPVPFALDEARSPKVMTLTVSGPSYNGSPTTRGTFRGAGATSYRSSPTTARAGGGFATARAGTFRSGTSLGTNRTGGPAAAETWQWIYKFEGDALVIAFVRSDKKQTPAEFKPRADVREPGRPFSPGVTVITLKRTTEPPPSGMGGLRPTTARATTGRSTAPPDSDRPGTRK